jgi:hypothetical protein
MALAVGFMVISYLVGLLALQGGLAVEPARPEAPVALHAPVEGWRDPRPFNGTGVNLAVLVRLRGGSDQYAYVLSASASLKPIQGASQAVTTPVSDVPLNVPRMPELPGATWRSMRQQRVGSPVLLNLTPNQLTQINEQGATIRLKGLVQVWEPYVSGQTTLRRGNTITSAGERARITEVGPHSGAYITLNISSISRPPVLRNSNRMIDFALVHTPTGDAIELNQNRDQWQGAGMLPLANVNRRIIGLSPFETAMPDWVIQDSDDLQLMRIRWRSLGSYPVDIEVAQQRPEQPR